MNMLVLVSWWQSAYYPGHEISMDETIIPFKERPGRVYKANKQLKWGLNCWNIAKANAWYI